VSVYGLEALRRLRDQQESGVSSLGPQPSLLEQVPPDAPMDDAVITVWNGERFVAYQQWLATAPLAAAESEAVNPTIPTEAGCVAANCGGTRIWLARDGDRWLMFVGTRKAGGRRKDFASPFLAHAMRTAEEWYGAAADGWREEEK
jgi:hypothetical protein